jgi:hypothetical protein
MTQAEVPAGSTVLQGCATTHLIRCLSFSSVLQLLKPRVGLVLSLVIILTVQYARSPWRKVPPGPRRLPILGNALQLQDRTWLFGKDCKRKFGVSSFVSVNNINLEVYKKYPRAHDVLECPWSTHSHLQ